MGIAGTLGMAILSILICSQTALAFQSLPPVFLRSDKFSVAGAFKIPETTQRRRTVTGPAISMADLPPKPLAAYKVEAVGSSIAGRDSGKVDISFQRLVVRCCTSDPCIWQRMQPILERELRLLFTSQSFCESSLSCCCESRKTVRSDVSVAGMIHVVLFEAYEVRKS